MCVCIYIYIYIYIYMYVHTHTTHIYLSGLTQRPPFVIAAADGHGLRTCRSSSSNSRVMCSPHALPLSLQLLTATGFGRA